MFKLAFEDSVYFDFDYYYYFSGKGCVLIMHRQVRSLIWLEKQ